MRIRETVLTYREENGFFIEVKCKEIMFPYLFSHTIPPIGSRQSECNTERNPKTILKRGHLLSIFDFHGF